MKCYRELSLEDMLADPIIQAVIDADGVDANELDAMLRGVAHERPPLTECPYSSGN